MIDLKQYGYIEEEIPPDDCMPGRITELQRDQYTVITEKGEVTAVLKGSYYHAAHTREDFPCVGDFVWVQYNAQGHSRITRLLPRRTKFSRADYSGHVASYAKTVLEQVVATNFDYVFIVTSLNQDFKISRIMRYLTQTRQSGAQPVMILTKSDLLADCSELLSEVRSAAPDVPVHAVSSHTGFGMEELNVYLQPGKTVVFLGMSGVGKSSLVNVLMQDDVMTVKGIRESDSRGRHTTTHRQLFMLPSGAMVMDTPGMRELGLFSADEGIREGYREVEDLFTQCRFSDCGHGTEPGCAVRAALSDGTLAQREWENYLEQKRENKYVEDKSGYLQDKRTMQKTAMIQHRNRNKKGGNKQ